VLHQVGLAVDERLLAASPAWRVRLAAGVNPREIALATRTPASPSPLYGHLVPEGARHSASTRSKPTNEPFDGHTPPVDPHRF